MKFATLVASAAAIPAEPVEMAQIIGSTICSAFDNYDFFNLKTFDSLNRDKDAHEPAKVSYGGDIFEFKACQLPWKNENPSCKNETLGTAYYIDNNGDCVSFLNADWEPIHDDQDKNQGLNWHCLL